jgi:hypothetical protein
MDRGYAVGGEFSDAWAAAAGRIHLAGADVDGDGEKERAYPGLDLQPRVGLVPLGPDPSTGLWEFGDLVTGLPPERDADGRLMITEDTGLVFVLIPAGAFQMGTGAMDAPRHDVTLTAPYFISKYEMTQGQWLRLTGVNPSRYRPDVTTAWGEQVSLLGEEASEQLDPGRAWILRSSQAPCCTRLGTR